MLLCLLFSYLAIDMISGIYIKIEPEDVEVKELATRAASKDQSDREPLMLFSVNGRFDRQSALFYSDRSIEQVTTSSEIQDVWSARRYVNYKQLKDVADSSPRPILVKRSDIEQLKTSYEIKVLAETRPEPPVETGFTPSPESRQAAVSKGNQTTLYKVLQ